MNWLLIVGILIFSTAPLYVQRQEQNVAKLKADARNVVGTIANDKAKTQAYCQTQRVESYDTPHVLRRLNSSGNFAILTAIRRASSLLSNLAADLRPGSSSK
jgi:hypothetical protein